MIDLRKQPPFTTYQSRYKIGDVVWYPGGAYSIPISFKVLCIKFQFDRYGDLKTYYSDESGPETYWQDQDDLFPTEQECYNSL
jgi:hypothetical protein